MESSCELREAESLVETTGEEMSSWCDGPGVGPSQSFARRRQSRDIPFRSFESSVVLAAGAVELSSEARAEGETPGEREATPAEVDGEGDARKGSIPVILRCFRSERVLGSDPGQRVAPSASDHLDQERQETAHLHHLHPLPP